MNLNTTYGGFDFGAQRVALHAAFRQHLWVAMCQVARETLIDLASVRSSRPYGRFPFTVRVVCGATVGSDVTESGEIVGEFGGSTGLTRLSAG